MWDFSNSPIINYSNYKFQYTIFTKKFFIVFYFFFTSTIFSPGILFNNFHKGSKILSNNLSNLIVLNGAKKSKDDFILEKNISPTYENPRKIIIVIIIISVDGYSSKIILIKIIYNL